MCFSKNADSVELFDVEFDAIDVETLREIAEYVDLKKLIDVVLAKLELVLQYYDDDKLDEIHDDIEKLKRRVFSFEQSITDYVCREIDLLAIQSLLDVDGLANDLLSEIECTGDRVLLPGS